MRRSHLAASTRDFCLYRVGSELTALRAQYISIICVKGGLGIVASMETHYALLYITSCRPVPLRRPNAIEYNLLS